MDNKPPPEYRKVEEVFLIRAIERKLEEYGYIIDGRVPNVHNIGPNERIFEFSVMGKYRVKIEVVE